MLSCMTPLPENRGRGTPGVPGRGDTVHTQACCYSNHLYCQLGNSNQKTDCKNTPAVTFTKVWYVRFVLYLNTSSWDSFNTDFQKCCSESQTPWTGPKTTQAVVDLWSSPGSDPELCRAHSCLRLDQATLILGRDSCSEVKLGLSRDRDKSIKCVFVYLQGAMLWCSQCNAPQSTEPLLLLRVQGHSCPSNTHTEREKAAC